MLIRLLARRYVCVVAISFFTFSAYAVGDTQEDDLEDIVETDFIFADFQLDNRKTGVELDLATKDYQSYFIELELFNEHFAANLSCDESNTQLTGEFWEGPVAVSLVDEEAQPLFFIEDEQCYFNIELLPQLNVRMRFDAHRQIFAVLTEGKHPKTKEIMREARKLMLLKLDEQKAASLEIDDQYQAFTMPSLDISANERWNNARHNPSFYVQSVFDLLYHQSELQLNVQKSGSIRGRGKFARKLDWGGDKLHYQMGDIQHSQQGLFNVPSRGLGFLLGERASFGSRTSIDLSGYAQPLSEVELYRNDLLIDFIQLDDTGFYEFKNIDLRDQSAEYVIRITTPDGQETEQRLQKPGKHGLTPSEWTPTLTYLDSAEGLFEGGSGDSALFAGSINYALSADALLILGFESKIEETRETLFHLALDGFKWADMQSALKLGLLEDQWLYDASVSYGFGNQSIGLSSQRLASSLNTSTTHSASWGWGYEGYSSSFAASESHFGESLSRNYSAKMGYNGSTWSFSAEGQRSISRSNTDIGNSNGNNNDALSVKNFSLVGSTQTPIGNLNLSYQKSLGSTSQKSLNMSLSKNILGVSAAASLRWDLQQKRSSTSIRLSKSLPLFRVSGNLGFTNTSGWSFGFGISFGLFADDPFASMTNKSWRRSSNVVMQPFLDENNNGIWDETEAFLPEVSLTQRRRKFEKGVAEDHVRLYGVDAYDPKLFTVDDSELDNPFIVPKYREIRIESHPGGSVAFQVPFHLQYEVEGEIIRLNAEQEPQNKIGAVPLHLYKLSESAKNKNSSQNTSGKNPVFVKTYYSEPDGFYVIDKLKSGDYRLVVDAEYQHKEALNCEPCEVEFNTDSAEDHLLMAELITLSPQPENKHEDKG
ncbi:hypothetical protein [Alteromonas sp. a30]|uniref:hypothetical protein n=1 Tax=Alteromonas sp. a30 TaxID=2730917 RepID=UPI00227FCDE4|nr:hypothetical protein [Alteromonas sp. a30]MCY7293834.1 hypothetical protein [Alteromonas sp. a30]